MSIPWWQYVLSMGAYIGFLLGMIDFMRKRYRASLWFWAATLLTLPLWLVSGGVVGWFRWMKILSVILPVILIGFTRISHVEEKAGRLWAGLRKDWFLWFLYAMLFLNIAEATMKDFTTGKLFNGAVGFLLCVTIPFPPRFWKFSKDGKAEFLTYTTVAWNFLYTTWNACFVFGESGACFASSICILLAAELYPLLKRRPELYIISRVYTLATHLILRACAPSLFPYLMDASSWVSPTVLRYWGMANLVLMVPYVFWHAWQLETGKANASFRRGRPVEA